MSYTNETIPDCVPSVTGLVSTQSPPDLFASLQFVAFGGGGRGGKGSGLGGKGGGSDAIVSIDSVESAGIGGGAWLHAQHFSMASFIARTRLDKLFLFKQEESLVSLRLLIPKVSKKTPRIHATQLNHQ